jgi:hypothetical protein
LELAWREWARTETLIRICTALYIQDAEISNIFHHETFFDHQKKKLCRASTDSLFMAVTPEEWRTQFIHHSQNDFYEIPSSPLTAGSETRAPLQLNSNQDFATYQILEGMIATITAKRVDKMFDALAETQILNELLSFHQSFLATLTNSSDPFDLKIL